MTIIIDPINIKYSHASFNATMIKAIGRSRVVTSPLAIYLEENQIKLPVIQNALNKQEFDIYTRKIYTGNNKLNHFLRTLKLYYGFLKTIRKAKPDTIFFLAADNLFSPLLALILKILKKKPLNIFIILHNNLENIQNSVLKKKIWSFAFQKDIIGLVLADFVRDQAVKKFPNATIYTIKHPVYNHLSISQADQNIKQYKADFLILGRHSNAFKDSNLSAKFFSACSEFSNSKRTTVVIKEDAAPHLSYLNVSVKGYGFPLDDKEYWNMLHTSRFLIIPPESAERVTASGVLADGLTANILIIAPYSGAFFEFIPSSCYDLLYNGNEIEKVIKHALSLAADEYNKKSHDMQKRAEEYSLKRTVERLNKISIIMDK